MSGEINIERNGLFGDDEVVVLTRARLNQLITGITARMAAASVTAREIADGSISAAKLAEGLISTDMLADLAVTTAKLSAGAVTREKLSSVVIPQIGEVYTSGAQTLTAGAGLADVTDLSITLTPRSLNSRFLLMAKLPATSASGGRLDAVCIYTDTPAVALGASACQIAASGADTLVLFHLLSPATSGAVTFKVQASATTNDIALVSAASSLLVQEII